MKKKIIKVLKNPELMATIFGIPSGIYLAYLIVKHLDVFKVIDALIK